MTYTVVKRNKRLHIVDADTDEIVYTPPDFLRVTNRQSLWNLAAHLVYGQSRIKTVMDFEAATPVRKHGRYL